METREQGILRQLKTRPGWSTAAQLAAALGCSVRSIKTSVANLNGSWPGIIESSHSGFRLADRDALARAERESRPAIPQTAEERRSYILRKLLMEEKQCDLDDLASELCISPVTLNNELTPLRASLLDYDLTLRTRSNTLFIEGNETAKKKMIGRLIYDETKDFFNSMELISSYFPNLDVRSIRETVTQVLTERRCFLNNYSLSNLVLHIAITIQRNRHGFWDDSGEPESHGVTIPPFIRQIVKTLCEVLSERFRVQFSDSDRYTFCVIIYTRCMHPSGDDQAQMIDPSVHGLLTHIRDKVKDTFDIDLDDHDFLVRFGLHIKNMLLRSQGGVELRNPQLDAIKRNYPYIYDIAVFIAGEINKVTGVHITEDEIAYIALHIGGLIEQTNSERSKLHAVLLYPGYYEDGATLMRRIWHTFQDSLLLENIISAPEELAAVPNCELLITTAPLPPHAVPSAITVFSVSNYLTSRDVAGLASCIDALKRKRLRDTMETDLKTLFKPELFYYRPPFQTVREVLMGLGGALQSHGFAGPDFCRKLLERESVCSSAIGNIAIPHPLDMDALDTAIAVAIYPQGLRWNANTVNIVFMLAIRKEDRPLFRDIFDFVSGTVMEPDTFRVLMQTRDYDSFLRVLLSGL